jgi:two-component system CheB/CheR fusion protein
LQVFEVEDGVVIRPNCIYIIPPNRDIALQRGTLQLVEPSTPRGQRLPIDSFFRSLAQDQGDLAIGIVLSGTGRDGTSGVQAIKGEGGMVMVQTPESAEYDGMPQSAIATGLADFTLPPAEMPDQLLAYTVHLFDRSYRVTAAQTRDNENALKKIFILLKAQVGHDFSQYKLGTLHRRIDRRMAIHQIETMAGYVKYLQQSPDEVEALFNDLLIGVTNFFRDPEAFKALEDQVIPKLFSGKRADSVIRVWVPGCSTGEEAYSIAILLAERQEAMKQSFKVQIFATDIDQRAIATARSGVYPANIATDITQERLSRFFVAEPEHNAYRIHKGIRDMLVFSEHNLIKDPPFSKLDLISCRNLLIYLDSDLQKKIIPMFHYALAPEGFLFQGSSETVAEYAQLFATVDRSLKLYQRKGSAHGVQPVAPSRFLPSMTAVSVAVPALTRQATLFPVELPLQELTEKALLQRTPAAVLVNNQGDTLYFHGRTGMFLEPALGKAGVSNIIKMAREGLQSGLATALHKAVLGKKIIQHFGLRVKTNGDISPVNLTVQPIPTGPDTSTEAPLYLVIFEAAMEHPVVAVQGTVIAEEPDSSLQMQNAQLREELLAKEEYIQALREQLETSTEELKSSNEEMQSVNEELQSTNEELETSKEELQSVNEEIRSVNYELQTNLVNLSQANDDMNNMLGGTGIGTVFVDHELRILRYTPTATRMINLIPGDVGRPVSHIVTNLVGYDSLVSDTQTVLNTLIPIDAEVQTTDGEWFSLRIQPYRTRENVIEGAVITFMDISERIKAREALRKANDLHRLAVVVRDAFDAITAQDLDGRIIAWNQGAVRMYGWSEAEALTMNAAERIPKEKQSEALARIYQLSLGKILEPYHAQRLTKDGALVEVWFTSTALVNETGKMYAIATTERAEELKIDPMTRAVL